MRYESRFLPPLWRGLLALAVLGAAACADETPLQPGGDDGVNGEAPESRALGLVEITISGIGSPTPSASAAPVPAGGGIASGAQGPRLDLTPAGGDPSGGIQLEPYSTGSFTDGTRGDGGVRYVYATFRVRNADQDGNAYDTPRNNLTFIAASKAGTINGTAISQLGLFDGSPADDALAVQVMPTGAVKRAPGSDAFLTAPDALQVFEESELTEIPVEPGVELFPYGFVVRNPSTPTSRTLPANPAADRFDGLVTFAFKIPLQATPAEDPFTVSVMFLATDDSETRITQSLEEQTPEGLAAFLARAEALGAGMKTVLPGSSLLRGDANDMRTVCTVRTAGPGASPTATMVEREVASVAFTDDWPLWAGGRVARYVDVAVAYDAAGNALADVPVQVALSSTAGVLEAVNDRLWRMVPRRDRASATATATACGHTSGPVTLRTSGYAPIAAGGYHTIALRADGTVVAWGYNDDGQTDVPAGLTNVVQLAAGNDHSVALKADGTVVVWGGRDDLGVPDVPAGLDNVVQIAADGYYTNALKADGTVMAWGANTYGETNVPAGLSDVVQVAASTFHSLALRADGTVVGWGRNDYGQTDVPAGLTNVVQVAAGGAFSLALKADGTVVMWGSDKNGHFIVPPGLDNVVQIAAGDSHALALRADGTVVGWGDNSDGQATPPSGLTDVVHIVAKKWQSFALKADGTVVAWGWNLYGQTNVPAGLVATLP